MNPESAKAPPEQGVAPLNFIYACSICCASFADVYEGHRQTVQGLSDGINPTARLVTRLFLANCCHVFCSEHLEGGGPPFHPAGQRPKAPCPMCVKEKGDSELRDLYSIRGFNKNEYDPQIPPTWFTAPPMRLDGNGKEMEALRFQYIALIRYCQNTYATRKPIQKALAEGEKNLARVQELASEEHAKFLTLQQEIEQLRAKEDQFDAMKAEVQRLQGLEQEVEQYRRLQVNPRDLETFTTNKTAIRHYLKLVPMLLEQNEKMKRRLASLGFAMALEPVPNFKGLDPHAFDSDDAFPGAYAGDSGAMPRKTASSHTAGRSAHASGQAAAAPPNPLIQRPLKRQRLDSPLPGNMQVDLPTTRNAMPPPPKPISRMHSVRKMFPALRKKFSHGRSTPSSDDILEGNGDIRMYDNGHWQDVDRDRSPTRDGLRGDTPYMLGALPVEQPAQAENARQSQLLSSVGINDSKPDFTFRSSSPVKMGNPSSEHRPVQLPTEPSYIRLMDGLSRDTGIELGLKDPRENTTMGYHDNGRNRQVIDTRPVRHLPREETRKPWSLGHPFLHQSPQGPLSAAKSHLNPSSSSQTNGFANRAYNEPLLGSVTPAPRRYQQPGHQIDSVVSPFFKSSHRQAPAYSSAGFAEPQDSSNRFDASQSRRTKMNEPQAGWHEPRSLNGLSFFDSPVNSRNEQIQHSYEQRYVEPRTSSRHYQSRNLNSRGLIVRPEVGGPPFAGNSAYRSSRDRPSYSTRAPVHSQSTIPFPSFDSSSYSRPRQLPSAMPTLGPSHTPASTQPQWENLQRMGVRSSRQTFGSFVGNTFTTPARNLFSSAGRRSVKR